MRQREDVQTFPSPDVRLQAVIVPRLLVQAIILSSGIRHIAWFVTCQLSSH